MDRRKEYPGRRSQSGTEARAGRVAPRQAHASTSLRPGISAGAGTFHSELDTCQPSQRRGPGQAPSVAHGVAPSVQCGPVNG